MRTFRTSAVVCGLWLLCVLAAVALMARGQAQQREGAYDRFHLRADTGASFVGAYVDDVFEKERRLAPQLTAAATRPDEFVRTTAMMSFSAAVLLDRQGRVVAVAPEAPSMNGVELASRYSHLSSALAGERAVSDIVPSAVQGNPIVAFALPLSGGRFGVFSAGFSLEDSPLKAFLERQPTAGTRGYILDSTGASVVAAGDGSTAAVPPSDVAKALEGPSVADGRLVAAAAIPGTSWTYVLDAPVAAVAAAESSGDDEAWLLLAGLAAMSLVGLVLVARAMASRTQARAEKTEADERFRLTVEHAPIGMTMVGLDYRFVEPNTRLCAMLGYSDRELEAMTFGEVTHPEDLDLDLDLVGQLAGSEIDSYEFEKRYLRRDGSTLWGRLTVSVVRDEHDQPRYFVSQIADVTDIRAAKEDLEQRALYDPLTGLANRSLLVDRLTNALDAARKPVSVAVGFCDLDHFKQVNDNHGHHSGDAVLKEVARRLEKTVRSGDTVARMGGDEFIILLTDVQSLDIARRVMDRARRAVEEPVEVDGHTFNVGLSGGLALARAGDTADTLLRNSDAALYVAKNAGRGRCEIYDSAFDLGA